MRFLSSKRAGRSLVELLIMVVVIAACIALVYVALNQFGVAIPQWAITCFWIVAVAVVVIFCIRFIAGSGGGGGWGGGWS